MRLVTCVRRNRSDPKRPSIYFEPLRSVTHERRCNGPLLLQRKKTRVAFVVVLKTDQRVHTLNATNGTDR